MAALQQEYKIIITDQTKDNVAGRANAAGVEQAKPRTKTPGAPEARKPVRNDLKALSGVIAVYGVARQAAQIYVQTVSNRATIEGNNLKAARLQNNFNNASRNVAFGLAAAYSLATMNPVAIIGTIAALGKRVYDLELQTNKYTAQVRNEIHRSQYARERLIRNISEVR